MTQEDAPTRAPIYVSYLTFSNLLDWLHEVGTLPSEFDRSFWGGKFSGSTGTQLMTGLRFLGLLDGDRVKPELEELALVEPDERKRLIADRLKAAYGSELVDNLPRMTPKMLSDAMKNLGTTDATHRKAISFFINAAKAVDLPVPSGIAKQARNRPPGSSRKPQRRGSGTANTKNDGDTPPPPPPSDPPEHQLPTGLPPALVPLIKDLTRISNGWTKAERDRWLTTFSAVLDYALPTAAEAEPSGE